MQNQLEPGHCCPIVMTSAAVPVLRKSPNCEEWLKKVLVQDYDGSDVPIEQKSSVTMVRTAC
jgi:putative acyl-CoA dehydrogenase